ncbi:TPA: hypothetical protein ACGXMH_001316 [Bacillus mobilis]|uniref:hypothetical protein n=1 Tax=Bacillus mobilis TaxID=2026190 RepID=UPI0011A16813|nr:hypothetical protein [Bacillus mobilis]MED4384976.1 hypothetical protein [Bacillus mobilis]HDX9639001.1 hypothetical protein [Bacillus mobilis]
MHRIYNDLDYNNYLILSDRYRYDFLKIDYGNTVLNEVVFMFRTKILETVEDTGSILIDVVKEENINAIKVAEHANSFIHFLEDTNFTGNRYKIHDSIELVKYDNEICSSICINCKNQRLYHTVTKELREFSEVRYLLFHEYDYESIYNISNLVLAPVFAKQLDFLWYKERYEDSKKKNPLDSRELKEDDTWEVIKNKMEEKRKYWNDRYKQAIFTLSKESLEFHYLPLRDKK